MQNKATTLPLFASLDIIILVYERDISNSTSIEGHKFTIAGWAFVTGISCKHALQTHANAFHCLDRGPSARAQEIETYDAVAVDMRVHGDRTGCVGRCG